MIFRTKNNGETFEGLTKETTFVTGRMGKSGSKQHAFKVFYVNHNNENIIVGGYDVCGSSQIMGITLSDDMSKVTCSKCLKSIKH